MFFYVIPTSNVWMKFLWWIIHIITIKAVLIMFLITYLLIKFTIFFLNEIHTKFCLYNFILIIQIKFQKSFWYNLKSIVWIKLHIILFDTVSYFHFYSFSFKSNFSYYITTYEFLFHLKISFVNEIQQVYYFYRISKHC